MKKISLINHCKGAIGLRILGLGPNFKPTNGLNKLQKLLDRNAFWAKSRTISDIKMSTQTVTLLSVFGLAMK